MPHRSKIHLSALLLLGVLFIIGSGGGGGGDSSTAPAAIDGSNAEDIGTTSGEGAVFASQIVNATDDAPIPFGIEMANDVTALSETVTAVARAAGTSIQDSNLPAGVEVIDWTDLAVEDPNFCGGSVTASDALVNSLQNTGLLNGSMTFNSLRYCDSVSGLTLTMNGQVIFSETSNTLGLEFRNFTLSDSMETITLDASIECGVNNCSYDSDFPGSDGRTHHVEFNDFSITGNEIDGFNVDATVTHAVYGKVTISTMTPIVYGICDQSPYGGSISYWSSNTSSGTITFNFDCSYSGTWDDGAGNMGTF